MSAETSRGAATNGNEAPLLGALVQTSYVVVDAVATVAGRHDLSLTLWRVMAILRDRTPTMSELATHLGLDRSTITGLVDRAVARGLLQKTGDQRDRRSSRVALTDSGRTLAQTCADDLARELSPVIERLTAPQGEQLTELLTHLGAVE